MEFFIGVALAALALWLVYLAGRANGQNSRPPSYSATQPAPTNDTPSTDSPAPSRSIIPHHRLPQQLDVDPPRDPVRIEDIPRIKPDLLDIAGLGLAAIIDTETTGLAYEDEIIEIAIALVGFDTTTTKIHGVADFYIGLREPSRTINRYATAANGLKNSDLKGHRLDIDKIRQMIRQSMLVVAHNAKFDHRFVGNLWMTEQYGLKKLIEHIWKVIGIASTCKNLEELRQKMYELYGKKLPFNFALKIVDRSEETGQLSLLEPGTYQ